VTPDAAPTERRQAAPAERRQTASADGEIPLAKPDLGEREEELVLEVLRSGRLSLGPMLDRFERDFAEWLGVDDAVAVSSGTAALHLGVRAMEWGRGDEVVTSPFSFVASANCLLYENAIPVFCDIDPVSLNMDPTAAEAACGERTVGLLPVHVFGQAADLPALEALADRRGLGIVEDACESLGAVDEEGIKVGARGNVATFAFYANKQLVTGEGGMLTCAAPDLIDRFRSERNQGRATDMSWVVHDRLGFNYRLSDLAAAIGVAQLERVDRILADRARVATLYRERLEGIDRVQAPSEGIGGQRRSWFVYAVQLADDVDRDGVIDALAARGISAKAYLPCIHLQQFYRERFGFKEGQFPMAEQVSSRSMALPFFTTMTETQVDRVCTALAETLGV
jgi:perosamine synthetase